MYLRSWSLETVFFVCHRLRSETRKRRCKVYTSRLVGICGHHQSTSWRCRLLATASWMVWQWRDNKELQTTHNCTYYRLDDDQTKKKSGGGSGYQMARVGFCCPRQICKWFYYIYTVADEEARCPRPYQRTKQNFRNRTTQRSQCSWTQGQGSVWTCSQSDGRFSVKRLATVASSRIPNIKEILPACDKHKMYWVLVDQQQILAVVPAIQATKCSKRISHPWYSFHFLTYPYYHCSLPISRRHPHYSYPFKTASHHS